MYILTITDNLSLTQKMLGDCSNTIHVTLVTQYTYLSCMCMGLLRCLSLYIFLCMNINVKYINTFYFSVVILEAERH